jgi:hypothetical protein
VWAVPGRFFQSTLLIHLSVHRGLNPGFQVLKVEVLKPRSGPRFFFSFFLPFSGGLPKVKTMQGRLTVTEGRGYPLVTAHSLWSWSVVDGGEGPGGGGLA